MADDSSDLLMFFMISEGSYVSGEATSAFDSSGMMSDFKAGSFFEIEDFRLNIGVGEGDDGSNTPAAVKIPNDISGRGGGAGGHAGGHMGAQMGAALQKMFGSMASTAKAGRFKKYLDPNESASGVEFPIEVQPFNFSRRMDKSTPKLFQHCATLQVFKQVTVVKRKFTGNTKYHEAFMRMDFEKALITKIDISNDEIPKETYEIICRKMQISYRAQGKDGKFDGPIPGVWDPKRKPVTHEN